MLGSTRHPPEPWPRAHSDRSVLFLRLALGVIWTLNLVYIVAPANRFYTTFAVTAASFGPSTLGGPDLAGFAAAHPWLFATLVGEVTAYLAIAFLFGLTTRFACLVGAAFNAVLLLSQFGTISTFPGATDIGPQPLYIAMYAALFIGYRPGALSVDRWLASTPEEGYGVRLGSNLAGRIWASWLERGWSQRWRAVPRFNGGGDGPSLRRPTVVRSARSDRRSLP